MKTPKEPEFPLTISQHGVSAKLYRATRDKDGRTYVEYTLTYREAGRRVRRTFADLDEAKREAALVLTKLASGQHAVLQLSGPAREEYALAVQELRSVNRSVPLLTAVREYSAAARSLGDKATLAEAVDYFLRNFNPDVPDRNVREVVDELIAAKTADGLSALHVKDLRVRLGRFAKAFGQSPIRYVRHDQIASWLRGLPMSPRSRNNVRNHVVGLFNFAKAQGYLSRDRATEADRLPKAKVRGGEVAIYTPAELRAILSRVAEKPDLLPFVAIQAFGGVRTAEVERLDWRDVDFQKRHILVSADKSKTASRRLVPMLPALEAWLSPLRQPAGPVCRWSKTQLMVQRAAAETTTQSSGEEVPGVAWKRNAMRHSFASYRLATTKSAAQVSLELGNSARMVFQHYRELATEAEANEWFSVLPNSK